MDNFFLRFVWSDSRLVLVTWQNDVDEILIFVPTCTLRYSSFCLLIGSIVERERLRVEVQSQSARKHHLTNDVS